MIPSCESQNHPPVQDTPLPKKGQYLQIQIFVFLNLEPLDPPIDPKSRHFIHFYETASLFSHLSIQ